MAKTKFKDRTYHRVDCKHTRICFKEDKTIHIPLNVPSLTIFCYPNFFIDDSDKVDRSRYCPQVVSNSKTKVKFESDPSSLEIMKSSDTNLEKIQKVIAAVCQIHVLTFTIDGKSLHVAHQSASCVLLSKDSNPFVLSCLHVFQSRARNVMMKCCITYGPKDLNSDFQSLIEDQNTKYESIEYFMERLYVKLNNAIEVELRQSVLHERKKFLDGLLKNGRLDTLLDPTYLLKPSPAVDISILDISRKHMGRYKNSSLQALEVSQYLRASTLEMKELDFVALIGFNKAIGAVDFSTKEYNKTISLEGTQQLKKPYSLFLHSGKSLSAGSVLKSGFGIITYKASSSSGSSGGPLVDADGNIVGISFANYRDEETPEKIHIHKPKKSRDTSFIEEEKSNPVDFKNIDLTDLSLKKEIQQIKTIVNYDVNVPENQSNYQLSKNFNLAIAIDHEFFKPFDWMSGMARRNSKPLTENSISVKITKGKSATKKDVKRLLNSLKRENTPQRKLRSKSSCSDNLIDFASKSTPIKPKTEKNYHPPSDKVVKYGANPKKKLKISTFHTNEN